MFVDICPVYDKKEFTFKGQKGSWSERNDDQFRFRHTEFEVTIGHPSLGVL